MRSATLAGLVLLALGGFSGFRGLTHTADWNVIRTGEFEARQAAGLALLVAGGRRRE